MDTFAEPFNIALAHWWQIGLTIIGCAAAIGATDYFGLNRPWPLSVILGGILSVMVMEAYPHAWNLGWFAPVGLWVTLSCMTYYLPELNQQWDGLGAASLWDFFDVVDENAGFEPEIDLPEGDSTWGEYSQHSS